MSDTIAPPPRGSSRVPSSQDEGLHNSSSCEGEFDTSFGSSEALVGATKEEVNGEVEARTDGKQKRKRTSPKDQAFLEAEYKQNPKPNKAARAEIVEKVSLNEKEVQIWFQNRRQINRRKSRPLLPHEIAALGLGRSAAFSSDPTPIPGSSSSLNVQEQGESPPVEDAEKEGLNNSQGPALSGQSGTVPTEAMTTEQSGISVEASLPRPTSLKRHSSAMSLNEGSSFSSPDDFVKSFNSTPGYLSNRWNNINSSFSTPSASQNPAFTTPNLSQPIKPASCGGRLEGTLSSPDVRLSLSLDGKAELVSASPSPPHAQIARPTSSAEDFVPHKRMRTLERSKSALPYPTQISSRSIPPFIPSLARGRSRDARTWQICCDKDTKDELTAHAERELNGSAVAAISLIRSTSNMALKAKPTRRNATTSLQDSGKHGSNPKLVRAQSSLARLQYTTKSQDQVAGSGKDGLSRSPSGDSDKENWLPGENTGNTRRRPLPASRSDVLSSSRTILGDNLKVPTHAVNLGGRNRKRKPVDVGSSIFDDQENGGDGGEEVEKFMRGEVSPSKKGDLDCIQGLLSLSQGNWR